MKRQWVTGLLLLAVASVSQTAPEKTRVFVTESNSWQIKGGIATVDDAGGGATRGGARPQTAEIIKTFRERCPNFIITMNKEKADYIVLLDHEGGKDIIRRDNKVVIFHKDGDAVYSGATRSLGNAVKDSCHAIQQHLASK